MRSTILSYRKLEALIKKKSRQSPFLSLSSLGKSIEGRDVWCVTIQKPIDSGTEIVQNRKRSRQSQKKTPVVITASIHGHEATGSIALLRFLDKIQKEAKSIQWLDDLVVHCVICCNPDGYVHKTRYNAEGFDLNRDFLTQSQPETQSIVNLIVKVKPAVVLDLHGYVWKRSIHTHLGLIEPCTPPHNPAYEYDLYLKWALPLAEHMEAFLVAERDKFSGERFKSIKGTYIPYRDGKNGWDDYSPFCCSMYSMLQGATGLTIESPSRSEDGTTWLVLAVTAALSHISKHRVELEKNQTAFFRRGIKNHHPTHSPGLFPKYFLLTEKSGFESAYRKLILHLQQNGIKLYSSTEEFKYEGHTFPSGTTIVPMNQARANLAYCFLSRGEDLSSGSERLSELCAWSLPLSWGVNCHPAVEKIMAGMKPFKSFENDVQPVPYPEKPNPEAPVSVGILIDDGLFHKKSHSGLKLALQQMKIPFKELRAKDLAVKKALSSIDVLIYNGYEHLFYPPSNIRSMYRDFVLDSPDQQDACRKNLQHYLQKGGKVIGIGAGASKALTMILELSEAEVHSGGWNKNALLQIHYKDHAITKGYLTEDTGFVYRPAWFTNIGKMNVVASYGKGQDTLLAGYWPDYHQAHGKAAIITNPEGNLILFGLEICFRGHTSYFYRLLWNAIHSEPRK
ncbi:DUF2817 domain-containing protein [Bacillus sp. Marseille-Q1617]|uniref:DUF2817 domain-containing protein n=1 Tax=Bacillus sp. Marseille-Q1617 TaxID=2736887 RepID=UPI0015892161|nr:DUF2817 domain-containing protein [Bacillus sp. Marseille-Q1617]